MNMYFYQHLLYHALNGAGDSDKHTLTLFALAISIRARRILELGVREGKTTLPFLCAAKEIAGTVESVDLEATTFLCPDELKPFWQFYQSDAIKYLENKVAANTQYDLIYIDDWHSYEQVKRELELVDSMITPSGLIVLHDLMYYNSQPLYHSEINTQEAQWANGGPYRAVAELDPKKWEFATIPSNHGLTILRKKAGIKTS